MTIELPTLLRTANASSVFEICARMQEAGGAALRPVV